MAKSRLPMIFVLAGIVLLVASWIWPTLVGGRNAWTEEDARLYEQITTERHNARNEYGEALKTLPPETAKAAAPEAPGAGLAGQQDTAGNAKLRATSDRVAQADERHRVLEAKLQRAQSGGFAMADALKWIGVVAVVIGVVGYYSTRSGGST